MLDQMQVSQLVPSVSLEPLLETDLLSALLTCPDFRDGLEFGQRICQEEYEEDPAQVPQTEEALVCFVNTELSTQMYCREKVLDRHFKTHPLSYLHHIGFVVGYLNHLMAKRTPWHAHPLLEQPAETGAVRKNRRCSVPKYPNRLRAYIKQEGYTIREVAREADIPEGTLRHWVAGRQIIPHAFRERLAQVIGCPVEELVPRPLAVSV
jgi:Helix-turn-helix domain